MFRSSLTQKKIGDKLMLLPLGIQVMGSASFTDLLSTN
jgi:hypothetical protein